MSAIQPPKYEIPRNIHLVWIGGTIPADYIANIKNLALLASNMDPSYHLNIWADKGSREANNFGTIPGLVVRDIENELISEMIGQTNSPFDSEEEKLDCLKFILFEYLPPANYAALSDLFRMEILRREGGIYLDTDAHLIDREILDGLKQSKPIKSLAQVFQKKLDGLLNIVANTTGLITKPEDINLIIASTNLVTSNIMLKHVKAAARQLSNSNLSSWLIFFKDPFSFLMNKKCPILLPSKDYAAPGKESVLRSFLAVDGAPIIKSLTGNAVSPSFSRESILMKQSDEAIELMKSLFDCERYDNTWLDKSDKNADQKQLIIDRVKSSANFYLESINVQQDLQSLLQAMLPYPDEFKTLDVPKIFYNTNDPRQLTPSKAKV